MRRCDRLEVYPKCCWPDSALYPHVRLLGTITRSSPIDIISAWNGAPPAERTKAMHGIGLKPLLTALPQPWIPLIQKWLVELTVEAPNSEIAEQTTKVGDSLDIPDFLRRDKWLKAEEAVE